jgi:hypothetical protein
MNCQISRFGSRAEIVRLQAVLRIFVANGSPEGRSVNKSPRPWKIWFADHRSLSISTLKGHTRYLDTENETEECATAIASLPPTESGPLS